MRDYSVAVFMITYNHVDYITLAVESVMAQKNNGRNKLFLGDDCSTDGTIELCKKLKEKYPDRIELLLNEHNIGATANAIRVFKTCLESNAQYIALLEGDDYWTDPLKLQKQVDAMRADDSLSIVLTNADKLLDGELVPFYLDNLPPSEFNLRKFITERYPIATCTALLKREVLEEVVKELSETKFNFFHLDFFIWCVAGRQGQYRFLAIKTGVYRIHASSIVRSTTRKITLQRGKEMNRFLADYLGSEYERHFLAGDWWYHLEFAFLAIEGKHWIQSLIFLFRSLMAASWYRQGRQLQIVRDYLYRLRNRNSN